MQIQSAIAGWCALGLAVGSAVFAAPPKVQQQDGHAIPVTAEFTFADADAPKATGMVYGVLLGNNVEYSKFAWPLEGAGGTSARVWFDTIVEVKAIDKERLTIVFADGSERTFKHDGGSFMVHSPNDSTENIPFASLQHVKFGRVPRKDREDHAMFDEWRHSPYTGEALPNIGE